MPHQHDHQAPKLIFVHGFLDDHTVWDDVKPQLEGTFETLAVDLPGAGDRTNDTGPFTLQNLSQSIVQEIDASPAPVILVGHSMGAQLVELAAAARPARVAGLVLLTPIPLSGVHLEGEAAESFRRLGGDIEAQREGRLAVTVSLSSRTLDLLLISGAKPSSVTVEQVFDAWNDGDPSGSESSAFGGPTLVINGKEDPFVTNELLENGVLPRFERISTVAIDDAGHVPHLEQPSEVARVVRDFAYALAAVEA